MILGGSPLGGVPLGGVIAEAEVFVSVSVPVSVPVSVSAETHLERGGAGISRHDWLRIQNQRHQSEALAKEEEEMVELVQMLNEWIARN